MAFKFRPRFSSAATDSPKQRAQIYIGIDFGTTFSKVSFQIGDMEGTTKYSIRFENEGREEDYCLPSILGYDREKQTLVFTQEIDESCSLAPIRYFKYSMIEKGVPREVDIGQGRVKNDPQRLCSAFYIAHLLVMVKKVIEGHDAVRGRYSGIDWYVNMGVPVGDFNAKPKPVYDEALNVAWQLAAVDHLPVEMSLTELDDFYGNWTDHLKWNVRLNTVPELYAELIMFLQNKGTGKGFYSVIDIGGGTVDIAIFLKRIDEYSGAVDIYCVAQEVCPMGYELYMNALLEGPEVAERKLLESYGGCLESARDNHRQYMDRAFRTGTPLIHFYTGGARGVQFYHDTLNYSETLHRNFWTKYPGSKEGNIVDFMRGMYNLEVKDNQRLLISQMLAQPYEKMPQLAGQPWNFIKDPVRCDAPSIEDIWDSLYGS